MDSSWRDKVILGPGAKQLIWTDLIPDFFTPVKTFLRKNNHVNLLLIQNLLILTTIQKISGKQRKVIVLVCALPFMSGSRKCEIDA